MPSSIRNYNSITTSKSLGSELLAATSYLMLAEGDTIEDFPAVPFTLVIEPGVEGKEEIVTVTEITGLQLTITRGEEGLGASQHNSGSEVRHMATGRDFQDSRDHIDATEDVHGISDTAYIAYTNSSQTFTNKTLTAPSINSPVINSGSTLVASSTELNYVNGATSNIQTQLDDVVAQIAALQLVPVGTIAMFGGATPPTGWLMCDGGSTTGYTALAGVVGANVPDLRGRAPIGYGTGTGLTARSTLGATVGAETHALIESEMPRHNHGINPSMIVGGGYSQYPNTGTAYSPVGTSPSANVTTYFTGGSGTAQSAGNGVAHNNMQPSTVVNFIIKY